MDPSPDTDYTVPGIALGMFSTLLAALNALQLWADFRFPGRRGGGDLQKFWHIWCLLAGVFDAISAFSAAYSVYDASMIVAIVFFDWMTMCGIFCVLKLVQLTVKNSFEVASHLEAPRMLSPLFVGCAVVTILMQLASTIAAIAADKLLYKAIFDTWESVPFILLPILCHHYLAKLTRAIHAAQAELRMSRTVDQGLAQFHKFVKGITWLCVLIVTFGLVSDYLRFFTQTTLSQHFINRRSDPNTYSIPETVIAAHVVSLTVIAGATYYSFSVRCLCLMLLASLMRWVQRVRVPASTFGPQERYSVNSPSAAALGAVDPSGVGAQANSRGSCCCVCLQSCTLRLLEVLRLLERETAIPDEVDGTGLSEARPQHTILSVRQVQPQSIGGSPKVRRQGTRGSAQLAAAAQNSPAALALPAPADADDDEDVLPPVRTFLPGSASEEAERGLLVNLAQRSSQSAHTTTSAADSSVDSPLIAARSAVPAGSGSPVTTATSDPAMSGSPQQTRSPRAAAAATTAAAAVSDSPAPALPTVPINVPQ